MSEKTLRDDLHAFVDFFERQWAEWNRLGDRLAKASADLEAAARERDAALHKVATMAGWDAAILEAENRRLRGLCREALEALQWSSDKPERVWPLREKLEAAARGEETKP